MSVTTQPTIPTIVNGDTANPDLLMSLPPLVFATDGRIVRTVQTPDSQSYRNGPGKAISTVYNTWRARLQPPVP